MISMFLKDKPILFAIALVVCSCQSGKNGDDDAKKKSAEIVENNTETRVTVDIYKVNPVFYAYVPDTANTFTDYKEMLDSLNKMYQRFTAFSNSLLDAASNKDSVIIEIAQAENRFRNNRSYTVFKFLKDKPKNLESIKIMSGFIYPQVYVMKMAGTVPL